MFFKKLINHRNFAFHVFLWGMGGGVAKNVTISDLFVTKLKLKDELYGIMWTFMLIAFLFTYNIAKIIKPYFQFMSITRSTSCLTPISMVTTTVLLCVSLQYGRTSLWYPLNTDDMTSSSTCT